MFSSMSRVLHLRSSAVRIAEFPLAMVDLTFQLHHCDPTPFASHVAGTANTPRYSVVKSAPAFAGGRIGTKFRAVCS